MCIPDLSLESLSLYYPFPVSSRDFPPCGTVKNASFPHILHNGHIFVNFPLREVNSEIDFLRKSAKFCIRRVKPTSLVRLSKNLCFHLEKAEVLAYFGANMSQIVYKMELSQLQFASFFRFMAANFSLTHRVTAAKPLWCV